MDLYIDDFKVRFSHIDNRGNATYKTLCDFADDLGMAHGDELGMGISYMENEKKSWFQYKSLSYMKKNVSYNYSLRGETSIAKMDKIRSERQLRFYDEFGEDMWFKKTGLVHVDLASRKIAPLDEKYAKRCSVSPDFFPIHFKKINQLVLSEDYKPSLQLVTDLFIDANNHVNNGYYGLWAMLDVNKSIRERYRLLILDVDYTKELALGDKFFVYTVEMPDSPYNYEEKSESDLVFKHAIHKYDNTLISTIQTVWLLDD